MKRLFLALLLLTALAACASKVPAPANPRQEAAVQLNQRAQQAFQRGEWSTAEALYGQALRLDVALENEDGIALNLLNLARVQTAQGRYAEAQGWLQQLLEDKALTYPAPHRAAAAVQSGLLRLRAGDLAGARQRATEAEAHCGKDCPHGGAIANLRANIALQAGEGEEAVRWAELAQRQTRDQGGVEQANALRLLARARLAQGKFSEARSLLDTVLQTDKALGLPDKIREDLLLLAQTAGAQGQAAEAARYRERAARVAAALQAK